MDSEVKEEREVKMKPAARRKVQTEERGDSIVKCYDITVIRSEGNVRIKSGMSEKDIAGLARDIATVRRAGAESGIIDPLKVRKDEKGYVLIDGHRRLAALKLLHEQKVDYGHIPLLVMTGIVAEEGALYGVIQSLTGSNVRVVEAVRGAVQSGLSAGKIMDALSEDTDKNNAKFRRFKAAMDMVKHAVDNGVKLDAAIEALSEINQSEWLSVHAAWKQQGKPIGFPTQARRVERSVDENTEKALRSAGAQVNGATATCEGNKLAQVVGVILSKSPSVKVVRGNNGNGFVVTW